MDNLTPIDLNNNERITESITLTPAIGNRSRLIKPAYGRFYTDTLVVIANNVRLQRGVDYNATYMDVTATETTGKEVCLVIRLLNTKVNDVTVAYHPYGGKSIPNDGTLSTSLVAANRSKIKAQWADVINKPKQFAVGAHTHQWYDLYAMNDFVDGLTSILKGIQGKRVPFYQASIDGLKQDISTRVSNIEEVRDTLDKHQNDDNNPHHVTAAQLGYSLLPHLPPSNTNALSNDRTHLLTVRNAKSHIYDIKRVEVFNHITRYDNPHQVTAGQADTYTTTETNTLASGYVPRGKTIDNAATLNGKTKERLHDEITRQIRVESIQDGVFPADRLGDGGGAANQILRGDGQWVSLESVFDQYTTKGNRWDYYLFPWQSQLSVTDCLNTIAQTYSDRKEWPVGSAVLFANGTRMWSNTQKIGKALRIIDQVRVAVLTDNGWSVI